MRAALRGTAILAAVSLPSTAFAQQGYTFSSCADPGLCGSVQAFFSGTLLEVRIANKDNVVGSALYQAQLIFSSALGATLGSDYNVAANSQTQGSVASIGTTNPGGWAFNTVGGTFELDLSSFFNVYVEGAAASSFRALPGDPNAGTWVTTKNGYVEFTADLSSIAGINGANLTGLGFCTDAGCVNGDAVVTPEPATLALCATGFIGLVAVRRRRKTV